MMCNEQIKFYLPAVGADEALGVELVAHGRDDPPVDGGGAHQAGVQRPRRLCRICFKWIYYFDMFLI